MTTYHGHRDRTGKCHVWVKANNGHTRPLPLRLKLFNHSPTGFEWGYSGSGPAQLALAILADALRDPERAVRLHQDFKFKVIAGLDRDADWMIMHDEVLEFAGAIPVTIPIGGNE